VPGYLDKGVVREQDAYVIAVNGRLLRGFGGASELVGISQFPFAVEATLAIGPLQVSIDATTLKKLSSGHQHRSFIRKPKGADVPTDTFLDPGFSPISAIWAVDVDEMMLLGQARPMVIVHNPSASIPLARNLLPAQEEYAARSYNDYFEVYLEDGLLANGAPRA
jgi:type I restriction enzyme S subunit